MKFHLGQRLLSPACALAGGALVVAFAPLPLWGGDVQVPHTFQSGATARASEVNENFTTLASAINDLPEPTPVAQRIVVATQGGEFDSVAEALLGITDASASKPYVVLVEPGVYVETQACVVPAHVSLVGRDPASTRVTSTRSWSGPAPQAATIVLEDEASLRNLTIENSGTQGTCIAVYGEFLSEDTRVTDCNLRLGGAGANETHAMYVVRSFLIVRDCDFFTEATTSSNTCFSAFSTTSGNSPTLIDCRFESRGISSGIGIHLTNGTADIEHCVVTGYLHAVRLEGTGFNKVSASTLSSVNGLPLFEQIGNAALWMSTCKLSGGQPIGDVSKLRFLHCFDGGLNPIDDGNGSSI